MAIWRFGLGLALFIIGLFLGRALAWRHVEAFVAECPTSKIAIDRLTLDQPTFRQILTASQGRLQCPIAVDWQRLASRGVNPDLRLRKRIWLHNCSVVELLCAASDDIQVYRRKGLVFVGDAKSILGHCPVETYDISQILRDRELHDDPLPTSTIPPGAAVFGKIPDTPSEVLSGLLDDRVNSPWSLAFQRYVFVGQTLVYRPSTYANRAATMELLQTLEPRHHRVIRLGKLSSLNTMLETSLPEAHLDTTLRAAFEQLERQTGSKIIVDWAEPGMNPERPITGTLHADTLRSALRDLLEPYLQIDVCDRFIFVIRPQQAHHLRQITRFYRWRSTGAEDEFEWSVGITEDLHQWPGWLVTRAKPEHAAEIEQIMKTKRLDR